MAVKVNIEKNFRDFSLKVDFEGSSAAIGLLGASGSGKSMTLRCIAGIETPDKGRIVINGKTVFDSEKGINLKPQKRRIGYLFQNYALFPTMTAEHPLRLSWGKILRQRKSGRSDPAISSGGAGEALALTAFRRTAAESGTGQNDDRRAGSYSSG